MTLALASLITKIFLVHNVDLPFGWAPMKREDPISAINMTRSRARLLSVEKQQKRKKSQAKASMAIGSDTDDKID